MEKELQAKGEISSGNQMGRLWQAVWGIQEPNNVKSFHVESHEQCSTYDGELGTTESDPDVVVPMVWARDRNSTPRHLGV